MAEQQFVMAVMLWAADTPEEAKEQAEAWLGPYAGGHVVYAASSIYDLPAPAQTVLGERENDGG